MLELLPAPPHSKRARHNAWQPSSVHLPPEPPSQAEKEAELQRLEQSAAQAEQMGGRVQKNRNRPRRTVDYFAGLERWRWLKTWRQSPDEQYFMRPNPNYVIDMLLPELYLDNYSTSVCSKFVHTSMNKIRCPVNVVRWTPEGRRVLTGAASGEFTLWNGLAFNFETILQAHDTAVRCADWSSSGTWLVSGDNGGVVKYFQINMNNLQAFQAHAEPVRDVSFSPNDTRFVTGSDDSTMKLWSFEEMREERTLTGHGWDVKCVKWHPTKGLLVSGSKDNLIKFWDPRSGKCLTTLHGHKNTVQAVEWNPNGNLVATGSRDAFIKVFDIRAMKELVTLRGHKREVCSLAWHPIHHNLISSGGSDGAILHWAIDSASPIPVDTVEFAHESNVWSLAYHPFGHVLASASNDHTTRFWCRNRPGQQQPHLDRYHVGKDKSKEMGVKEDDDADDDGALPGLGGHHNAYHASQDASRMPDFGRSDPSIPGFGGYSRGGPPDPRNGYGGHQPQYGGHQPQYGGHQQQYGGPQDDQGPDRRRRRVNRRGGY